MGKPAEPEVRAGEFFAEYLERREKGEDPDLDAFLDRDPEAAPFLRNLLEVHEALFPSLTQQRVGDYRLVRVIGQGGMGIVYEAEQISLKRRTAIKFLPRIEAALDPRSLDRFEREMAYLAKLEHPHIVPVFDAGQMEGRPYFVMPLLMGQNLAELIAERKRHNAGGIAEGQALQWMIQIASSLKYVHGRDIIHRDIKPSNIFISSENNDARLLDFGLARSTDATALTRTGQTTGTPAYMSPEQIAGDREIGPATDLYLFGATFFETLSLHRPFEHEDWDRLRRAILEDPPPRPGRLARGISRELDVILLRCLHKNPEKRFPSADELLDDLRRLQNRQPILTRPPSVTAQQFHRVRKLVHAHPAAMGLAVLLLVALLAVTAWFDWRPPPRDIRHDTDVFEVRYYDPGGLQSFAVKIRKSESATGKELFASLAGTWVSRRWRYGKPLMLVAELDHANDSLELVLREHQPPPGGFIAVSQGRDGAVRRLWKLKETTATQTRRLAALEAQGFRAVNMVSAPGLLEHGYDTVVLVLGREGGATASVETMLLFVDRNGRVRAEYRAEGALGWTGNSVSVCEIEACFRGDDRPEILISGFAIQRGTYPRPVLTALKPDDRVPGCRALTLELPVTTLHKGVDVELRKSLQEDIDDGYYTSGVGHALHVEKGRLAYLELAVGLIYYYIEYDTERHRFEWTQMDYSHEIRDILARHAVAEEDLPYDVTASERLQGMTVSADKRWRQR